MDTLGQVWTLLLANFWQAGREQSGVSPTLQIHVELLKGSKDNPPFG